MRNIQKAKQAAYSDEAINDLLFMIQEEKLAGDLYENFYAQTGLKVFLNIAKSEDKHMASLVKQAEKAGIDVDSLLALPAGEFTDTDLQGLYDSLLVQGSVSADAALEVGKLVEETDIADLNVAKVLVIGTPLEKVYGSLLAGSEQHFDAFDAWLTM
jgi:hypothetical protein